MEEMIKPKKNIEKLYRMREKHSDSRYGKVRLDRNERTISFDRTISELIREKITDEMLMVYPEPDGLYRKLAGFVNVPAGNILLNSGSDQTIKSVFETYIGENDRILLHDPSYAMYQVYADMFGAKVIRQEYESDFSFDRERFLSLIDDQLKMVVFENPNGFIGVKTDSGFLEEITKKAYENNVIFLADEAYFHFIEETMTGYIDRYPNVIITRTFSKALGLASCRIGYLVSSEKNISNIYKTKPMHELTQFSIIAAETVIDNFSLVAENILKTKENLEYLKNQFKKLNISFSDGQANFLVAKLPVYNEEKFNKLLENNNVLIRRPFEQSFLKGYRRIGVAEKNDLDLFLSILKEEIISEQM
jgi:histidinol-phosphate aminotransferase